MNGQYWTAPHSRKNSQDIDVDLVHPQAPPGYRFLHVKSKQILDRQGQIMPGYTIKQKSSKLQSLSAIDLQRQLELEVRQLESNLESIQHKFTMNQIQ